MKRVLTFLKGEIEMRKFRCTICDYVYDPALGDPSADISPGTSFDDLPDDWVCPDCGLGKELFEEVSSDDDP